MIHVLALTLALAAAPTPKAPTLVHVGQPLLGARRLTAGVHRYVRYTIDGDARRLVDVWTRRVTYETRDGVTRLRLRQRWDEARGPVSAVEQDAWFEPGTLRPLSHVRSVTRDGRTEVGGYAFHSDKVTGLADLPGNSRRDFVQASPEPAYNFEFDMELLQALPLAPGYAASLMFYDPGRDPPARYVFRVAGSERILGPDGRPMDCWVVSADYNTGHVLARFWLAKGSQLVIREEQEQPDGGHLVKALLPPESGDRVGRVSAGPAVDRPPCCSPPPRSSSGRPIPS